MVEDMLAPSRLSPPYDAEIAWLPAASEEVENTAVPAATLPVPRTAWLSKKVTLPVVLEGVTVAVSVTDWPTGAVDAGDIESARVVVVLVTDCVTAFEVLPPLLESPLYTAESV